MIDIAEKQRQMTALKAMPVSVAKTMLRSGQLVIARTIQTAALEGLPGPAAREKVRGKLKWHASTLSKFSDPNAVYASGDDLRKWVMQAYIESNAVEEGSAYADQLWSEMWTEIKQNMAALPAKAREAVIKAASGALETVTGIPTWAWGVGAAIGLGLIGFVGYKIVTGPAGAMVARRYLP